MGKPYPPIQYSSYLKIDSLLSLQEPCSNKYNKPAHDENLFIIIHQIYELWFKQILTELDSVLALFSNNNVDEKNMGIALARLRRVVEIEKILVDQIRILETMTPLDFLDFRDMLYPASGFQSSQFRLFENKLGLRSQQRLNFNKAPYSESLCGYAKDNVIQSESEPSLFDFIEQWLERTPFLETQTFDFWKQYQLAVMNMFQRDAETVQQHNQLSEEDKNKSLQEIEASKNIFQTLFSKQKYDSLRKEGSWRLSHKAIQSALFIMLYRDQPILQQPFALLTTLQDIDELLTSWRYQHALMAHRMLGTKIGTSGSVGHKYLSKTAERHKVFQDFFNLATFFIPRSELPPLSQDVEKILGFHYSNLDSL